MANEKIRHLKYEKLRRQLVDSVAQWPHIYQHKIIGKNEEDFRQDIRELEQEFPLLNKVHSHLSRNGTYVSVTYEIRARDVDDIIRLWVASERVRECITVL